jgi:phosphohistidine phosphatase
MRLIIVRHGIAEFRNVSSGNDEDRKLTAEGLEKMRLEARGLRAAGFVPDVVWSSPLVRARQTAETLLETFDAQVPLITTHDLAPGGDRGSLFRGIVKYSKTVPSLMLVGHLPSIGEIAGELSWGSPDHYFNLEEGGVCVIDLENCQGELNGSLFALLPPAVVCSLG